MSDDCVLKTFDAVVVAAVLKMLVATGVVVVPKVPPKMLGDVANVPPKRFLATVGASPKTVDDDLLKMFGTVVPCVVPLRTFVVVVAVVVPLKIPDVVVGVAPKMFVVCVELPNGKALPNVILGNGEDPVPNTGLVD